MSGVSFVSETEADEIRKKRQEEWEKVRKEDDPLECPEQVRDNRTLFERLEEQKQKKQDEWDEQHQLKNMVRGLDGDETVFLDMVAKQQEQLASRRFDEESQEIKEYRNAVSQFQSTVATVPTNIKSPGSAVSNRKSSQESGAKRSQLQLIAGAIRRKSSGSSNSQSSPEKKAKICEEVEENHKTGTSEVLVQEKVTSEKSNPSSEDDEEPSTATRPEIKSEQNQEKQAKQVIPGLGVYSDSSDSETSSSES